jgi:hypothetical protein
MALLKGSPRQVKDTSLLKIFQRSQRVYQSSEKQQKLIRGLTLSYDHVPEGLINHVEQLPDGIR